MRIHDVMSKNCWFRLFSESTSAHAPQDPGVAIMAYDIFPITSKYFQMYMSEIESVIQNPGIVEKGRPGSMNRDFLT